MSFFRNVVIADQKDQKSISSGNINIDWATRCLSSKRNRRNVFVTLSMWSICLLIFAPAGPVTFMLFRWYWTSTNIDTVPWQIKYYFLAYAALDIAMLSIITLFNYNKKLISRYSILYFYVKLINFSEIDEERNKKISDKEIRENLNKIDQGTRDELEKSTVWLVSKNRFRYYKNVNYTLKPLRKNFIFFSRVVLMVATIIQLISTIALAVGGLTSWPISIF